MMTSLPQPFTNTVPQGSNWLRRVIVDGATKITGGRDDELTIEFQVQMWHSGSPNMARITVRNVSLGTVQAWKGWVGKDVTLSAGYEFGSVGPIFQGQVKQTRFFHENPVDTCLDIFAADSDTSYRKSIVTKTLPRGWTPQDKVDAALEAMEPFGVTMGVSNLDLSQPKYPRGTPLIGLARDLIREVTLSAGGLWSVQMGKLMLTKKDLDTGNSGTVKLTAQTGLVGYPQQTQDGIVFQSLINPNLQPLMKVTLDPSQIVEAERNNNPFDKSSFDQNTNLTSQALGSGTYTIYKMDRAGSSRYGQEFYDTCVCIGQGGTLPSTITQSEPGYSIGSQ